MADKKLRQQCTAVDMYEQPQLWHYMYFKSEKKKHEGREGEASQEMADDNKNN